MHKFGGGVALVRLFYPSVSDIPGSRLVCTELLQVKLILMRSGKLTGRVCSEAWSGRKLFGRDGRGVDVHFSFDHMASALLPKADVNTA